MKRPLANWHQNNECKLIGQNIFMKTIIEDFDVEEFDKAFLPKEKLKLPGQIFG